MIQLIFPYSQPNTIPPVSQTLPATSQIQSQQPQSISSPQKTSVSPTITTSTPDAPPPEKPQSNGTSELKTPTKLEEQSNHVLPPSTLSSQITQVNKVIVNFLNENYLLPIAYLHNQFQFNSVPEIMPSKLRFIF